eukprot:3938994-Rhodomonas_salina.1
MPASHTCSSHPACGQPGRSLASQSLAFPVSVSQVPRLLASGSSSVLKESISKIASEHCASAGNGCKF